MAELTLAEKIDRAKEGRTQSWIIGQMNKMGCRITTSQFSQKKIGVDNRSFTDNELLVLSNILKIDLKN